MLKLFLFGLAISMVSVVSVIGGETMISSVEDWFYPPEENQQRTGLIFPKVNSIKASDRSSPVQDPQTDLVWTNTDSKWELVALLADTEPPMAIFERNFERWGQLSFVGVEGMVTEIRKSVGQTKGIETPQQPYPEGYEDALKRDLSDVWGETILNLDEDASYEACAAVLPDLGTYTFLATPHSSTLFAVETDGRIGPMNDRYADDRIHTVWFNPYNHLPTHRPVRFKRGLLGGYIPAIDYGGFDPASKIGWEEMAFAVPGEGETSTTLWIALRLDRPDAPAQRSYFRCNPECRPVEAADFFTALLHFHTEWSALVSEAMEIDVPEPRVRDASLASLARAIITYTGSEPRYGVGVYAAPEHATFPPTTLSMVNACIEWNLLDRARLYLDTYLDRHLKHDGTFQYYGPAISEYGQMLDLIARYVRRAEAYHWLCARLPQILSITTQLRTLRNKAVQDFPRENPRHGMLFGSPEADTRKEVDYYYSGNVWVWRGWREIGLLLAAQSNPQIYELGQALLKEADELKRDIETSLEASLIETTSPVFVPPTVGFDRPFACMTEDLFSSYTNYRYWIEQLSAGCLKPEWADAIIKYRRTYGGELLGTTRFLDRLDDWPYAGYAYGLLLRDRIEHFLLGYYGDLSAHRMRGTFTAYEQVYFTGYPERRYVADYCVPAQLITPLLTKWMLVFEEPDDEVLWLGKAIPRRWLEPGNGVSVKKATTRWGCVDYTITPVSLDEYRIEIALSRGTKPLEIRLRLRHPQKRQMDSVWINNQQAEQINPEGEYISFDSSGNTSFRIQVTFQ